MKNLLVLFFLILLAGFVLADTSFVPSNARYSFFSILSDDGQTFRWESEYTITTTIDTQIRYIAYNVYGYNNREGIGPADTVYIKTWYLNFVGQFDTLRMPINSKLTKDKDILSRWIAQKYVYRIQCDTLKNNPYFPFHEDLNPLSDE